VRIGYQAGVYATDWSWAPLFADLDNDGYKDCSSPTASHNASVVDSSAVWACRW